MKKNIPSSLSYVQIDLSALKANLREIRRLTSLNSFALLLRDDQKKSLTDPQHILPVIKADAYGHGVDAIARQLEALKVGYLGVSDVREGIYLRQLGLKNSIVLFETTLPEEARAIVEHDLLPTVCTMELAAALDAQAARRKKMVRIHIKVDTGMGRLGVWYKDAFDFIREVHRRFSNLIIHGIYTHYPSADSDKNFTYKQTESLYLLVMRLDQQGLVIPCVHASNSMGLAGYKTKVLNLFRPGLMLYGLYPLEKLKTNIRLRPVMSVHSKVIFIKRIEKGRSISYGRTFIAKKAMTVATIPIGYSNGYFRSFSNKAHVLIGGRRCPVLGRVTMDQIIVDVTHVKGAKLGTPVVIMGTQKNASISADDLAQWAGTINYEIVCALGNNLPRRLK